MMQSSAVRLDRPSTHVALVTLDRPDARNAIDPEMTRGLDAAIAITNEDPEIRVVILTGSGSTFCAGADLKSAARGEGKSMYTEHGGFAGFVEARRIKPWIAAVNGPAVAGGFEIVLGCDLIVACEAAVFGLPEVKHALIAAAGGLANLPRRIPKALALELVLTGATIDARKAQRLGLVNRVVASELLLESALELAAAIAGNAPLAVLESLAIVRQVDDLTQAQLMILSNEARARVSASRDYAEGVKAFVEKRTPHWRGN